MSILYLDTTTKITFFQYMRYSRVFLSSLSIKENYYKHLFHFEHLLNGKIMKTMESTLGMNILTNSTWPMRMYFQMGIPPPVSITVMVAGGYALVGYLVEEVGT